ncbi:hypothetical protein LTR53_015016 [Teratosphaeriaceae sp. CCFEE 6253]|nr:hypothetical protein LTR53_015016 [Teratosphaeriaceae sp. CCFEE 6253]
MPVLALTKHDRESDEITELDESEYPISGGHERAARRARAVVHVVEPAQRATIVIRAGTVVLNYQTSQHNYDQVVAAQGYIPGMPTAASLGVKPPSLFNGYREDAPLASNDVSTSHIEAAAPSRASTPEACIQQREEWYKEGRVFRIWALTDTASDVEIHDKKFILLDTKIIEGKGVRVDTHDTESLKRLASESDAHYTSMVLKGPRRRNFRDDSSSSQQRELPEGLDGLGTVHLDRRSGRDVAPGSIIGFPHTYNIPFKRYKCEDLGMLGNDSLDELRLRYLLYLAHGWRLEGKLREKLRELSDDDSDDKHGR